ncbi:MAG TPA: formylglycine-generating enzyme family protein [Luteolibacter sp.]
MKAGLIFLITSVAPIAAFAQEPGPEGMVLIPAGQFSMGTSDDCAPCCTPEITRDASPVHRVYTDAFWMDTTEVTNDQFAKFVKATGYVTIAERKPDPADFPGAPSEILVAGSTVFTPTPGPVPLRDFRLWWCYVPGADWRHPTGPDSGIEGRGRFPVVQIAWEDAAAYAKWADKRLPTEAEWERAARGGLEGKPYAWGDALKPEGKFLANIYQGVFPVAGGDTGEDGFKGIAPVAQFPPNGFGLFDMAGNVWEWCADWYDPASYAKDAGKTARNPKGPADPLNPEEPMRVQRGGSFLCTEKYCTRYLVGSRGKGEIHTASNHLGFRCVQDATP